MQRRWLVLLSLAQRAYSLVPPVKLTDLVVEVDFWTHFSDCFTRDDDPTKGVKERDVLYSAILADAINLGLLQMAQVTPGMSLNQLAWMSDYYLREETYQKALSEIVNFHHRFPFSSYWGEGKTASAVDQLQLFSRQNTHSYLQMNDYEKASAEKPGNGPSAGCRQRRVALSAAYTRPGRSRCPDPGDLQTDCWCAWLLTTHCNPASCQWTSHKLIANQSRLRKGSAFRRTAFESRDIRDECNVRTNAA